MAHETFWRELRRELLPDVRPVLVGQAPNRRWGALVGRMSPEGRARAARRWNLTGAVGERLADLMGLTDDEYVERTVRHNLLELWPGPDGAGPGDAFPIEAARAGAERLLPELNGRRVVLLGQGVRRAFRMPECGLFEWHSYEWTRGTSCFVAAVVPHPSRVNRWWNDPAHEAAAREFLTDLARGEVR